MNQPRDCILTLTDSEQKGVNFTRFIILESEVKILLTILSPFLIQKVIAANKTQKNVKYMNNGAILVEVEKKHAGILIKVFYNRKIKT